MVARLGIPPNVGTRQRRLRKSLPTRRTSLLSNPKWPELAFNLVQPGNARGNRAVHACVRLKSFVQEARLVPDHRSATSYPAMHCQERGGMSSHSEMADARPALQGPVHLLSKAAEQTEQLGTAHEEMAKSAAQGETK